MSDIKCVVCGEPWDAYGVSHGDMLLWEAKLFKAGAGCPSCEGQAPETGQFQPTSIADIENGDEDPAVRLSVHEDYAQGIAPVWERPKDTLLWSCASCGIEAIRDADDNSLVYRAPYKSRASYEYWHRSLEATEVPEHVFDEDTAVCEQCLCKCAECGEPIAPNDPGDGGYPDPRCGYYENDRLCSEDCLSVAESEEAQAIWSNMSTRERVDYMFDRVNEFGRCFYQPKNETETHALERWRTILANVRGVQFDGYESELVYR